MKTPGRRPRSREKGFALILVLGFLTIAAGVVVAVSVLSRGQLDDRQVVYDRMLGQYLCETAASIALLDMKANKIGTRSGQWMQRRDFRFAFGSREYRLNYRFFNSSGVWTVVSWVNSPAGLPLVYRQTVRGRRSFPLFIFGFGGA